MMQVHGYWIAITPTASVMSDTFLEAISRLTPYRLQLTYTLVYPTIQYAYRFTVLLRETNRNMPLHTSAHL